MENILIIDSSPSGANSFSRKLSEAVGQKLQAKYPGAVIVHHDLTKNPTPHLEESHLEAFFTPAEKYSDKQKMAIAHSDQSIDEIMKADAIVIGVPMYNFSVPSVLKA
jgi:FMN-dependent NADH-azoreductase